MRNNYLWRTLLLFIAFSFVPLYADPCGDAFLEAYDNATSLHEAGATYCDSQPYSGFCHAENDLRYEKAINDAYDDWVNC